MSTQLTAQKVQLPAHLQDVFGEVETNIKTGVSVPTLGFKNKVWSVRDGDKVTPIMLQAGTDSLPSPFVDVVIVGKNPERSRIYYEGKYDAESSDPPVCSSSDGIRPDAHVTSPQSSTCAACPQNVKGSKMAKDGITAIKACGTVQRLVVVPADDLDSKPLLLSFRGNSMYDPDNAENEKKHEYCYSGYEKSLMRDGINNVIKVITRIGFDTRPTIDGVKLLFKRRDGWLDADAARKAVAHMRSEAVLQLASGRIGEATPRLAAPVAAVSIAPPAVQAAPLAPVAEPVKVEPAVKPAAKKPVLKPVPAAPAAPELTVEQQIEAQVRAEVAKRMAAQSMEAAVTAAEVSVVAAAAPASPEAVVVESDEMTELLGDWGKV